MSYVSLAINCMYRIAEKNRLHFRFVLARPGKPVIIRLITCANYAFIHAPDKIED